MKQIFHHYSKWEETFMWQHIPKEQAEILLEKAIEFTGNYKLYGSYMLRVLKDWPISCEQNLTDNNINKRAWIGHAACYIAIKCPEYITRKAWHYLTQDQQDLANSQADIAIDKWEKSQCQKLLWE